jgi:predicted cupin superfamily sugar epimerase
MAGELDSRRGFLRQAGAVGAVALASAAGATPLAAAEISMPAFPTADDVIQHLALEPNQTCGFVRLTYKSALYLKADALPAPLAAERPLGSGLYFLVTPQAPVRLHRIQNDQLYHYYLGDPIELLLLHVDGRTERAIIGPDVLGGQQVQFMIPGGTFHTARIIGEKRWFLGGSTEWPGVIPADVELGNADALAVRFPSVAADIRAYPVPVPL